MLGRGDGEGGVREALLRFLKNQLGPPAYSNIELAILYSRSENRHVTEQLEQRVKRR
jgi:hypothetical protein